MKLNIINTLIVSSTLFALSSCGGKNESKSQQVGKAAVNVSTTQVTEENVIGFQKYPAVVVPLKETELRAEVSGYVTNILVADGATVSKGQRLYEIDRTRYLAEVEQAKANLKIAQADYNRVEKDLGRYKKLAEQDAIAKQTLDYAETDLNNQAAQVQSAKAALTTAEMNLSRSVIVAPFAGRIGISLVRNGALVSAGTTLLNTISTTNPVAVEFQVNERDIARVESLLRSGSSGEITVNLPDGTEYGEKGKINTIDRAVDRSTGTLKVRANFNNTSDKLRAGMNVVLNLAGESHGNALVVPQAAVLEQLGTFNVYVVSDSSTAVFKEVKLGIKTGDKVVIESGLEAGEQIIVDGANNISEGAKVTIQK